MESYQIMLIAKSKRKSVITCLCRYSVIGMFLSITLSQARTLDCDKADQLLQEYSNRQKVLNQTVEDFDAVYRGDVSSKISVNTLFVVDLDDPQKVQQRIAELSRPVGSDNKQDDIKIRKDCKVTATDLVDMLDYIAELQESIRVSRLFFLQMPDVVRAEVIQLIKNAVEIDVLVREQQDVMASLQNEALELNNKVAALDIELAVITDNEARKKKMNILLALKSGVDANAGKQLQIAALYKYSLSFKDSIKELLTLYLSNEEYISIQSRFRVLWRSVFSRQAVAAFNTADVNLDEKNVQRWKSVLARMLWQLEFSVYHYEKYVIADHLKVSQMIAATDLPTFVADLHAEYWQLISIPLAPYFIEWYRYHHDENARELLNFLLEPIVSLLLAFIVFGVLVFFIYKIPARVSLLQSRLLKKGSNQKTRMYLAFALRLLRPHTLWVPMLLVTILLPSASMESSIFITTLNALGFVFYSYHFLHMLLEWLIARSHFRVNIIVSHAQHKIIRKNAKNISILMVIIYGLVISIYSVSVEGYIASGISVLALCMCWLLFYKYIAMYKQVILKFFTGHSRKFWQRLWAHNIFLLNIFLLPVLFVVFHIIDIAILLHTHLLAFEIYQKISAKILKIRLEQLHQEEPESEEETINEAYERWFSDKVKLNLPLIDLQNSLVVDINKCTSAWMKGRNDENDLLICGENGSGKKTLIQQWQAQWNDSDVLTVDVPPKVICRKTFYGLLATTTASDKIENVGDVHSLDNQIKKTVIIINNAHNLFLADEDGFEAYKALLDCINARLDNIFWVVVSNIYSANYLNYIFSSRQQFSYSLTMPKWSQQDIRQLIMTRHTASKRRLYFDELLLSSTSIENGAANIAAETRCFNLLWDQSGGNPAVAMALWVQSATKVKTFGIEIGVPERPSASLFKGFSDDLLFVYASIITHDNLTVEEVAGTTNLPESIVIYAVKVGLDSGFLDKDEKGRCSIVPLWYLQLVSYLNRKNFLHE